MVFPGACLFRAPILCPSGGWRHARGREHCRGEPRSALSGGYAPDSAKCGGKLYRRRARGGLNLCARESKARTGRFLREKLTSDYGHFLPTRATRSGERARFVGIFQRCRELWTTGCWLARRVHQLKASTTMDLGISIFLIFVRPEALRNLDLLIKTGWSVICPPCC